MNHGGTEQVVLSIANHLDYNKYDVSVISLYQDKTQLIPLFNKEVQITTLGFLGDRPAWMNYLRGVKVLYSWLKQNRPDIIHAHSSSGAYLYLSLMAWVTGVKSANIRTIHFSGFFLLRDSIINQIRYWIDRIATIIQDPIIVGVSPVVLDTIKDLYPQQKQICIVNGVDASGVFNPLRYNVNKSMIVDIPKESCVVTYVARVVDGKNHRILIDAWKHICKIYDKVFLLLVGDGDLLPSIAEYTQELRIDNRVKCLGARRDIAEILSISDIGVFPSISEGLSLVLLEKMAMGLPIVVSRIPSFEYIIEDKYNGLFYDTLDDVDLAHKIEILLLDETLRDTLGNNAKITVNESFSMRSTLNRYLQLYDDVLIK